ncbi:Receptor-Type Tyrosine-Protein Phosphatase-Like N [Manis pentadactyla]|nr:Receptor-Type Tyrosine-Protein Phosphatase-Like N [Manis pentadactyla]
MLLMSYGSWDNTEEPGTTEVSTLPTGTSPSSCHRLWRPQLGPDPGQQGGAGGLQSLTDCAWNQGKKEKVTEGFKSDLSPLPNPSEPADLTVEEIERFYSPTVCNGIDFNQELIEGNLHCHDLDRAQFA